MSSHTTNDRKERHMVSGDILTLCREMYNKLSKAELVSPELRQKYESLMLSYKGELLDEIDVTLRQEAARAAKNDA